MLIVNLILPPSYYDVNLSTDKKQILLMKENVMLAAFQEIYRYVIDASNTNMRVSSINQKKSQTVPMVKRVRDTEPVAKEVVSDSKARAFSQADEKKRGLEEAALITPSIQQAVDVLFRPSPTQSSRSAVKVSQSDVSPSNPAVTPVKGSNPTPTLSSYNYPTPFLPSCNQLPPSIDGDQGHYPSSSGPLQTLEEETRPAAADAREEERRLPRPLADAAVARHHHRLASPRSQAADGEASHHLHTHAFQRPLAKHQRVLRLHRAALSDPRRAVTIAPFSLFVASVSRLPELRAL